MTHTPYVLVGADGSDEGERAVRFAIAEARRRSLPVRLVHVPDEAPPLLSLAPVVPAYDADAVAHTSMAFLDDAVRTARQWAGDDVDIQGVVRHGPRIKAILEAAQHAELIVLGTRSSRLRRILTGSTTTGVAGRAPCPVVCVPAGWDETTEHLRVVAAVDGSPATGPVLEAAVAAAALRDRDHHRATVTVLHAWQPRPAYDDVIEAERASGDWQRDSERMLAELTAGIRADHPERTLVLSARYEPTAEALVEASESADLLVVGRRGHGAPFGLSLGSVARSMISHSACPVMVVPAPKDRG